MQTNKKIEIITKSAEETKKLGIFLAQEIYGSLTSIVRKYALVVSLEGDLGAGKTTFTQGFAKGLGIKEKIQSPTYVILKNYKTTSPRKDRHSSIFSSPLLSKERGMRGEVWHGDEVKNFIHIDAYRISAKDLPVLNWKEIIKNPQNIIFVEWGGRIKKALPKKTIHIFFKHLQKDQRKIRIFKK